MQVACADELTAGHVRVTLQRLGITEFTQSGPFLADPTITIQIHQAMTAEEELIARREIGRLPGTSISN